MMRLLIALALPALAACASADAHLRDALALLEEGRAAAKAREYDRAVECFTEAVRTNPDLAEAYYERGIVRVRLRLNPDARDQARQNEERALADFGAAIQKNPAYADAYFNRAMLRSSRAQYKPAVEDLLNAVRFRPADPEPHLFLGQIYETKFEDRIVSAMEHYEKHVELGGVDPAAREKVKAWKQLKQQMAPGAAPSSKAPTADDEQKARDLHEEFKRAFAAGKKPEALAALEQLVDRYGRTKYAQERAREFGALLAALKK
jgi:tetratricopeptide (TPR) repeat protein